MASHRSRISEGGNVVHEGTPGMEATSSLILESSPYSQSLLEFGVARQCAKSGKWRSVNAAARATRHGPLKEPPMILLRYKYLDPCPSLQATCVTKKRPTFAPFCDRCATTVPLSPIHFGLHVVYSRCSIRFRANQRSWKYANALSCGAQLPISLTNRLVVA